MKADFIQNKILLRTQNLNFKVVFQRLFSVCILFAFGFNHKGICQLLRAS